MAQSLYQKYRPQQFTDVSGQEHITRTLCNELENDAVAHAYLFSGPRGVGKTTSARLLARAVNCAQRKAGEPCGECKNCTTILKGQTLDIIEIDAASHTGVDNVRENIIEHARVAPSHLPWKVFIIDEVHMLSTSAFNALLKTLEEPPKNTMFILATTELHKVPETIISRCERFTFHRILFAEMMKRLQALVDAEQVHVEEAVLALIARRSEGCLRDAESLLGQVLTLDDKNVTLDMVSLIIPRTDTAEIIQLWEHIVQSKTAEAIAQVNRLVEDGMQIEEFMKAVIETLRSIMVWMIRQDDHLLENIDSQDHTRIQTIAEQTSVKEMARMIDVFLAATEKVSLSSIQQLPLELAIVELTYAPTTPQLPVKKAPTPTPVQQQPAPKVQPPQPEVKKDEPVETKVEPIEEKPHADTSMLTLEDILRQWAELLEQMKKQNHALYLTFQVGNVIEWSGEALSIGFQYQFYQDRLLDVRNAPSIDAAFTAVYGAPLPLDIRIGKEFAAQDASTEQNIEQPSEDEVANVWDLAQSAFGAAQPDPGSAKS